MADYTKSGGISTAKARRKDNAARNKAHGLATRGRTKRSLDEDGDSSASDESDVALAAAVPEAREKNGPATYVMVEHRRRDSGAVARALDLTAPDAPAERVLVATGPDGEILAFAVECVTHRGGPVHYATASRARKEVKSSHKWCEACRGYLARTPATRNKATAQTRRRNR
jgi:hypothetical protein